MKSTVLALALLLVTMCACGGDPGSAVGGGSEDGDKGDAAVVQPAPASSVVKPQGGGQWGG